MINVEAYCLIGKDLDIYYKYYIFSLARYSDGNLCWKEECCSDNPPEGAVYLPSLVDRQRLCDFEYPSFRYKNFKESDLLFSDSPLD